MPEVKDKILALPSKPPLELEETLRRLKGYESVGKAPAEIKGRIAEGLYPDTVLAVWVRAGYGFGREIIYSVEDCTIATATHEVHKQNYLAYNPRLVRVYNAQDLTQR